MTANTRHGAYMVLRNAPTRLMKEMGYGKDTDGSDGSLLPEKLKGKKYLE